MSMPFASASLDLATVASGAIIVAALWFVDRLRLRGAARRIDAAFKRLAREPQWSPLAPGDRFPADVIGRLDAWESLCTREFGFEPLIRLREHYADGETLGVRSVLLSPDRTVAATFACSHLRSDVAFRSFGSRVGEKFVLASDAKTFADQPAGIVIDTFTKSASAADMHLRLGQLRRTLAAQAQPFADAAAYVDFQLGMWRATHASRAGKQYVVEFASLRKLAPPTLSDARLRRIHREILRWNR